MDHQNTKKVILEKQDLLEQTISTILRLDLEFNDRLVHEENVVGSSKFIRKVIVEKTFNTINNEVITQIRTIDEKTNGNGAFLTLIKNGPG